MHKIELVKLEEFDTTAGQIYSVSVDGSDKTLYDLFLEENYMCFRSELQEIVYKLKIMSSHTGFIDSFFKLNERKTVNKICVITDFKGKLKLYCIRIDDTLLILGGDENQSKLTVSKMIIKQIYNIIKSNYTLQST